MEEEQGSCEALNGIYGEYATRLLWSLWEKEETVLWIYGWLMMIQWSVGEVNQTILKMFSCFGWNLKHKLIVKWSRYYWEFF